jgi:hypothetical protein
VGRVVGTFVGELVLDRLQSLPADLIGVRVAALFRDREGPASPVEIVQVELGDGAAALDLLGGRTDGHGIPEILLRPSR